MVARDSKWEAGELEEDGQKVQICSYRIDRWNFMCGYQLQLGLTVSNRDPK